MTKIKTSELIGAVLNWAVAKCENVEYRYIKSVGGDYNGNWWYETRRYSTDWSQGGYILSEKEFLLKESIVALTKKKNSEISFGQQKTSTIVKHY